MSARLKQDLVYLVADEEAVRTSLEAALIAAQFEARTFASKEEFIRAAPWLETGCLISYLPDRAGFELNEELKNLGLALPALVMTKNRNPKTITRAMQLGIMEVLPRRVAADRIVEAVRRVLVIFKDVSHPRESRATVRARLLALTALERAIVAGLAAGRTKSAIADELKTEVGVVEAGFGRAMRKLHATNLAHLLRLVLEGGIKLSAITLAVVAYAPRLGVM